MTALYSQWSHVTYNVPALNGAYDGDGSDDGREPADLATSNTVSSEIAEPINGRLGLHTLMIDLDVLAYLIPSSTPGHSHLYVDVAMDFESQLAPLLKALATAGVIEPGYAGASLSRGATFLRLPWVRKPKPALGVVAASEGAPF